MPLLRSLDKPAAPFDYKHDAPNGAYARARSSIPPKTAKNHKGLLGKTEACYRFPPRWRTPICSSQLLLKTYENSHPFRSKLRCFHLRCPSTSMLERPKTIKATAEGSGTNANAWRPSIS